MMDPQAPAVTGSQNNRPPGTARNRVFRLLLACCAVGTVVWTTWVYTRIRYYETHDEARPAGAIAVFGAAEYDGTPSPVLRARLKHALTLYQEGLAPLLITLGGKENGDIYTEGGVGRDYLMAHGVPEASIIAETKSDNTEQSVARLAVIARKNHIETLDVVSDGSHLFRIHALCVARGLKVFTSPRPDLRPAPLEYLIRRRLHEIASYTAWRLHLH
jgi:uncharacterized SAM-binding protein YcdF (DUF218 family)